MYKFSISKYFVCLFLFTFIYIKANDESVVNSFFANISSKSNDSSSLDGIAKIAHNPQIANLKIKVVSAYGKLTIEQKDSNLNILSSVANSSSFTNQIVSDFRNELSKNSSTNSTNSLDINTNFTILVSNDLCDILGVKSGAIMPNSLLDINSKTQTLLLSDTYVATTISEALLFLSNASSKNEKKFAEEDEIEDLRLRINILYYDEDLVQIDELALNPTIVTTGKTARFRAKGGTSDYLWRLIPADGSDARISSTTGSDISYTAGTTESRDFDVLVLTDSIEEVSLNVVVAKARLKNDGSGSKGSGCFIRQKFRD